LFTWNSAGVSKTGFLYSDSAGVAIGDTAGVAGNNTYYNKTSNFIANYINGTEALRLTSSSLYTASGINVGFGTSSTSGARLNVVSTGANSRIAIGDTAADTYSTLLMYGGLGKYNFQLGVQNNVNNAFEITPSTAVNGTTFSTPAFVIDSSSNVGIGTSLPAYKLDVNGTSNITTTAAGSAGSILGYQAFSAGVVGNHDTADAWQWKWAVLGASGGGGTGLNTRFSLLRTVKSQATDLETLTVDSLGNLGLGVAPSATTGSGVKGFEIGGVGNGLLGNSANVWATQNTYFNSGFKKTASGYATMYNQSGGTHNWNVSTTSGGTAGDAISFTQAMTLGANGYLSVGDTSTNYPLTIKANGTNSYAPMLTINPATGTNASYIYMNNGGSGGFFVGRADSTGQHSGTTISAYDSFVWNTGVQNIVFGTNNAERARIDSSGNFGIGTNSPSTTLTIKTANNVGTQIFKTADTTSSMLGIYDSQAAANASYTLIGTDTTGAVTGFSSGGNFLSISKNGTGTVRDLILHNYDAANIRFATNNTERARIDSSGNLLVGTTAFSYSTDANSFGYSPGNLDAIITHSTGTSSGVRYMGFLYGGGIIGSITQSGTTAVLYNTTSDQRLKENIQNADSASSLIDSLQVRQYNWKSDGSHQRYGFIAQELVTVAPEAVHQPADTDEMMAVDYSKLVPMLVKEIQSLRQRLSAANL
jgi:hypothetical protein